MTKLKNVSMQKLGKAYEIMVGLLIKNNYLNKLEAGFMEGIMAKSYCRPTNENIHPFTEIEAGFMQRFLKRKVVLEKIINPLLQGILTNYIIILLMIHVSGLFCRMNFVNHTAR